MVRSQLDFIRQQGFAKSDQTSDALYSALMFQPRVIVSVVTVGLLLQGAWIFLVLSAVLWWSALVPTHNPFEAFYNHVIARPRRRRLPPLGVAPAPRRFAQGLAASVALSIGLALLVVSTITAWVLEGLFAGALLALLFGRFCVGSYLYDLVRSRSSSNRPPLSQSPNRGSCRVS